jgi:hypothetical protein
LESGTVWAGRVQSAIINVGNDAALQLSGEGSMRNTTFGRDIAKMDFEWCHGDGASLRLSPCRDMNVSCNCASPSSGASRSRSSTPQASGSSPPTSFNSSSQSLPSTARGRHLSPFCNSSDHELRDSMRLPAKHGEPMISSLSIRTHSPHASSCR